MHCASQRAGERAPTAIVHTLYPGGVSETQDLRHTVRGEGPQVQVQKASLVMMLINAIVEAKLPPAPGAPAPTPVPEMEQPKTSQPSLTCGPARAQVAADCQHLCGLLAGLSAHLGLLLSHHKCLGSSFRTSREPRLPSSGQNAPFCERGDGEEGEGGDRGQPSQQVKGRGGQQRKDAATVLVIVVVAAARFVGFI